MTIQEAYEQLSAVLLQDESIVIESTVWWHSWQGRRDKPTVRFMVSWANGKIYNGPTLEDALALALVAAKEETASNTIEAESFMAAAAAMEKTA